MPRYISSHELISLVGTGRCPPIVDVRRRPIFDAADARIPGAVWRDHMRTTEWAAELACRNAVVYCAHGHNVSEIAAAGLRQAGVDAAVLGGGFDAWRAAGGLVVKNAPGVEWGLGRPSVWVTRERPKVDRIACPWLIRRFIDPRAIFHFVAAEWVGDVAAETGAIPFDIEGVHYSHCGDLCSFDTMLGEFGLDEPALLHLARIVRGADTARPDLEPQAAGLLAMSLGLSAGETDDLQQLDKGMILYDTLYSWLRYARSERHNWPAGKQAA